MAAQRMIYLNTTSKTKESFLGTGNAEVGLE
jgi:hypothetical protein